MIIPVTPIMGIAEATKAAIAKNIIPTANKTVPIIFIFFIGPYLHHLLIYLLLYRFH